MGPADFVMDCLMSIYVTTFSVCSMIGKAGLSVLFASSVFRLFVMGWASMEMIRVYWLVMVLWIYGMGSLRLWMSDVCLVTGPRIDPWIVMNDSMVLLNSTYVLDFS